MIKPEIKFKNDATYYCRICGYSGHPVEVFSKPEVFRCGYCGTVQAAELPSIEQLKDYYGKEYLDHYTAGMNPHRYKVEIPLRYAAKLAFLKKKAGIGSLLDVGCAEGFFLQQAISEGFEAVGCDYGLKSEYPQEIYVKEGSLDLVNGLPFEDEQFKIVTCWAVIEHVRQPQVALQEVIRVLRKGGYLFLDTPLCGDLSEKLVAARSHWLHPPEHLHIFTAKSLRLLLERSGFEIIHHSFFYERNRIRWLVRRLRNISVGMIWGGGLKLINSAKWNAGRCGRVTQIGDIQMIVARKP